MLESGVDFASYEPTWNAWLSTRRATRIRFPRWLFDNGYLPGLALPDAVPAAGPRGHVD